MLQSSRWFAAALFLAAASLCAADSQQGSFERNFTVTGPVDLGVLTRSGDITIRNGAAGMVTVKGKIHVSDRRIQGEWQEEIQAIEKNPPVRQSGNSIQIEYLEQHNLSVDYEISTPPDTTVHTRTSSGDQRAEGLNANLTLESSSGDIRLRDITGEVRLHTGSGDVDAHDISGTFDAEAGSGDIKLNSKGSGNVHVHTGSGTVELREVNGSLLAESGSGDVRVMGTQAGTWEVRTGSGEVEIELPANAAFDLDASATSGEVTVGRPVTMVIQGELRESHRAIRGKVAGGGPELRVHTGSGDIHIN
jgi:DUF4097 and DUF4098 domain-containing protein YvlB